METIDDMIGTVDILREEYDNELTVVELLNDIVQELDLQDLENVTGSIDPGEFFDLLMEYNQEIPHCCYTHFARSIIFWYGVDYYTRSFTSSMEGTDVASNRRRSPICRLLVLDKTCDTANVQCHKSCANCCADIPA